MLGFLGGPNVITRFPIKGRQESDRGNVTKKRKAE